VRQRFWDDITKGVNDHMLNRFAALAALCMLVPVGTARPAAADPSLDPPTLPVADAGPPPDADAAPPPDNGFVASAEPGVLRTPEGWTLTVSGKDETQLPVPPLTTALSSREYLVGGTFTGSVTGQGTSTLTGGTLEAGYQIGCGINSGNVKPFFGIGITPTLSATRGLSVAIPITGRVEVELAPGTVILVPADKKTFKGRDVGIKITSFHVKVDGCVGQSFLRSYATLTSSAADTDTVVAYYGVTKVV
jgi:MspA protein